MLVMISVLKCGSQLCLYVNVGNVSNDKCCKVCFTIVLVCFIVMLLMISVLKCGSLLCLYVNVGNVSNN